DAADTEHDLLPHSHFEIAAVKLGCDESIFRAVLRDIGVEQVKFDASDLKFPNAGVNIAVQNPHRHQKCAIVAPDFPNRQMMKILIEADRVLDSVLVDFLPEISVSVEQADGDKVQIAVAGRFAMIAGENAETAGIIRDGFVESKFGGEIRHRFLDDRAGTG